MCWRVEVTPLSDTGVTITHMPDVVFLNNDSHVQYNAGTGWGAGTVLRTEARIQEQRGFFRTKDEAIEWGDLKLRQQVEKYEQTLAKMLEKRQTYRLAYGLEG